MPAKDDWVMLINRSEWDSNDTGSVTPAEKGYNTQIAFARVVNVSDDSLTLDGPDFTFSDPNASSDGDPDNDHLGLISPTYIVHLKNVVNVVERTFTLEGASNWNISN